MAGVRYRAMDRESGKIDGMEDVMEKDDVKAQMELWKKGERRLAAIEYRDMVEMFADVMTDDIREDMERIIEALNKERE